MRVAIIDDEELEASATAADVRAAGLEAIIIPQAVGSVADTAAMIAQKADAALIDHRLRYGNWSAFDGASLADALWELRFPAVLVTMFKSLDASGTIRRHRAHIPVVLARDELTPEAIAAALSAARAEVQGEAPSLDRRSHRAMLYVEEVDWNAEMVDASIPQWRSGHAIRFPLDLVPGGVRENLSRGDILVAHVNIDAEADEDIFVTEIEAGPEPDA